MEQNTNEEFKVNGEDLVRRFKQLVEEGKARKIIIKNDKGETMLEVPMVIGAVGVLAAPVLAAVGALAALMTNCTIIVEKKP